VLEVLAGSSRCYNTIQYNTTYRTETCLSTSQQRYISISKVSNVAYRSVSSSGRWSGAQLLIISAASCKACRCTTTSALTAAVAAAAVVGVFV
jgi:hypothetical protein